MPGPSLSLAKRLGLLESKYRPENRYVDLVARFEVIAPNRDTIAPKSGAQNHASARKHAQPEPELFGGRYDQIEQCYVEGAEAAYELQVSSAQYAWIIDENPLVLGYGGRGSGKSHGLARWAFYRALQQPGRQIMCVSPTYKKTKILWSKILGQLPDFGWLMPGKRGIRKNDREIHFINGSTLRFFSADNPDSLRGETNDDACIDERQDISQEAVDNVLLTLRKSENYQLRQIGTPKIGTEFYDEYERYKDADNCNVYQFSSYENPFVPRDVFDMAREVMDEHSYRQEVLAEWVVMGDLAFSSFDNSANIKEISKENEDITVKTCISRFNSAAKYIIGVRYPGYALVMKLTSPDAVWIVDEIVTDSTDPEVLGRELIARKYKNSLIIDDATAKFGDQGRLAFKILRKLGFNIRHASHKWVNPKDLMISANYKLKNAAGARSMFISPKCTKLIKALQTIPLLPNGRPDINRLGGELCLAMAYPVYCLYPPAVPNYRKFM